MPNDLCINVNSPIISLTQSCKYQGSAVTWSKAIVALLYSILDIHFYLIIND